jgi:tRNA-splicing ligase RtcB
MKRESTAAPMCAWTVGGIPADAKRSIERVRRLDDVVRVAVLPDVHVAGSTCVGLAVATRRLLYPALIGQDIGCGLTTVAFDAEASSLATRRELLLGTLLDRVPIIRHRSADAPAMRDMGDLSSSSLAARAAREGRYEIGTLGRGNHFVEFERDADDRLWILVHSGSRAMGEAITEHHLRCARRRAGGLWGLDLAEEAGQAYELDLEWARRYAAANRRQMLDRVAEALATKFSIRADWSSFFDCDHNHVERVTIGDESLLVHRKGASRASFGTTGLIPGAMGRDSFHVEGRGVAESLWSSSHGAGRVMDRALARRRIGRQTLEQELLDVTVAPSIRMRLAEESPSAYRDVHAVMRAQRELVRVRRVVRGFVVHRAVT